MSANAIVFVSDAPKANMMTALLGALKFNDPQTIHVIGCEANRQDIKLFGVHHHSLLDSQEFQDRLINLRKDFRNDGPNSDVFEFFCFARFKAMQLLFEKHNFSKVLHIDTDLILFENIDKILVATAEDDLTLLGNHSTYFSIWNASSIKKFADFLDNAYFGLPQNDRLCDMAALNEFVKVERKTNSIVVRERRSEICPVYSKFRRLDLSFREFLANEVFKQPELTNSEKMPDDVSEAVLDEVIEWKSSRPFFNDVPLNLVHLQGDCKKFMDYFHSRIGK